MQSYVVHLGRHSHISEPSASDINRITQSHHDLLASSITSNEKAKDAIFYSYTRYFNGFAVVLEEEEAALLSKHPKVVSIMPNRARKLHTTNSWQYLGFEKINGEIPLDSLWRKAKFGEDIIIATLDIGVWPESKSFNDDGMGPIPSKWRGYCEPNGGVRCNRKLIGARYFNKGYEAAIGHPLDSSYQTARDFDGHGTHTLSTAGGSFVPGANFLGSSNGTSKGGSPKARVASYKVCWPRCTDADIFAAIEAAIYDRVDVLSISVGSDNPQQYIDDGTAIGSFYAVQNGIVVVCSGGNEGPDPGTVSNLAPWIITVAASSIDRDFPSNVILGNNEQFKGKSFKTNTLPAGKFYPLVHGVDVKVPSASAHDAEFCHVETLDPIKIKGKIVYCVRDKYSDLQKSKELANAGAVGVIIVNPDKRIKITPEAYHLPTSMVSLEDGLSILTYIYSTKSPIACITGGTEIGRVSSPIMADFSSTGPNVITPGILKPDITAPGVYILAAYTEARTPFPYPLVTSDFHAPFNIISGTSMSCPHVSGIAALLKAVHPHWSPAAIKSAIMTTARIRNNLKESIANASLLQANPFNYGAGHIWPGRAVDPGLVYDLTIKDYFNFLCSIGYNSRQLSIFSIGHTFQCQPNFKLSDMNYPSITVPNLSGKVTLSRTLKNVGTPGLYNVKIYAPNGISVQVEPETLEFSKLNEQKVFRVTLQAQTGSWGSKDNYVFGELIWTDGKHHVTSPIVVKKHLN